MGTDVSAGLISGLGRSHDGKVYRLERPGHSQQAPEMLHPGLKPARRDRREVALEGVPLGGNRETRIKNTDNTLVIQKDVRRWSGAQG